MQKSNSFTFNFLFYILLTIKKTIGVVSVLIRYFMTISTQIMTATEFKSKCLGIMKNVHNTGQPVIITKRGVPFVKILPISSEEPF